MKFELIFFLQQLTTKGNKVFLSGALRLFLSALSS